MQAQQFTSTNFTLSENLAKFWPCILPFAFRDALSHSFSVTVTIALIQKQALISPQRL